MGGSDEPFTGQPQAQGQSSAGDARSHEMTLSVAGNVASKIVGWVKSDPGFTAALVAPARQILKANGVPPEAVKDVIGPAGRLPSAGQIPSNRAPSPASLSA